MKEKKTELLKDEKGCIKNKDLKIWDLSPKNQSAGILFDAKNGFKFIKNIEIYVNQISNWHKKRL